jgi:hypothetical protein
MEALEFGNPFGNHLFLRDSLFFYFIVWTDMMEMVISYKRVLLFQKHGLKYILRSG